MNENKCKQQLKGVITEHQVPNTYIKKNLPDSTEKIWHSYASSIKNLSSQTQLQVQKIYDQLPDKYRIK